MTSALSIRRMKLLFFFFMDYLVIFLNRYYNYQRNTKYENIENERCR